MRKTPLWLLDIDGVVNAIARNPDFSVWESTEWKLTEAMGLGVMYHMMYSTVVVDFINNVVDNELAEVRWHTTWQDEAEHVAEALGIRLGLPVAEAPEFRSKHTSDLWWKAGAAHRVVFDEERPLIWTDDDLAWQMVFSRPNLPKSLTISPQTNIGLQSKHLKQITDFLEALGGQTEEEHAPEGAAVSEDTDLQFNDDF